MHRCAGSKGVVEKGFETPVELGRLEARADDRNPLLARQHQQLFRRFLRLGDDDAGQRVRKKRLDGRAPRLRIERCEIGDLGLTQDMNAVGAQEASRVPGEYETGARRLRRTDLPLETNLPREQLELERIALAGEEVADLEPWRCRRRGGRRTHRASDTLGRVVRRGRGVSFSSRSWRLIRAIARSSAER